MRRAWFQNQDADGTYYYRNCPLIEHEQTLTMNTLLPWRRRTLETEWQRAWDNGYIRADQIGRRDQVVKAKPFREAYPDHPGLWILDEPTA